MSTYLHVFTPSVTLANLHRISNIEDVFLYFHQALIQLSLSTPLADNQHLSPIDARPLPG